MGTTDANKPREVFHCVIVDLVMVGAIYCYLVQNYWRKDQEVVVKLKLKRKNWFNDYQVITANSMDKVNRIYHYLLEKWTQGKLKVKITERPS